MNPEEAIKAIRAQGGTDADVEAYLRSIGAQEVGPSRADTELREMLDRAHAAERGRERQRVSAEEKKLTGIDRLGANLQRFSDMATFGVSGLLDDAVTAIANSPRGVPSAMQEQFRVNRQARRMAQEGLSPVDRVASTLVGAAANPVGAVIKVPAAAGLLGRIGATSADAALQGGVTGAVEGLEDVSREGLLEAGRRGAAGATGAVVGTNLIRGVGSVARGANTLRRVAQAPTLGRARIDRANAMRAADDFFFGGVLTPEAQAVGTSPAIRAALVSPTMKKYADRVRANEAHMNKTDAEILLEAYKGMSAADRAATSKQLNTADLIHDAQLEVEAVRAAKARIVPSVAQDLPTLPIANAVHASHRRDIAAFEDVADAVSRIISKSNQKGKKIAFESPEALEEGIRRMTPSQAEAGIEALLGRAKKTAKFSPTPLGVFFGIPTAALRTAVMPSQVNPYLRLLEKQAGRQPRLFDNPVVMERGLGTASRTIGGLLSQY